MLSSIAAWLVVVLHVAFCLGETVGWSVMAGRLGMTAEGTELTRSLALNQGFYNLGVAALLAWALVTKRGATVVAMLLFVVAMSVVGATSVRWTIFVAQGVPAVLAVVLWLRSSRA